MKRRSAQKKKVLVALSGGIDSAVSAYLLLKQGYQVEAAFMKNWSPTAGLKVQDCPWLKDRQDAFRVAAFLRVPLHTLDFEKQYGDRVMKYFFDEYRKGRTPNPDVMCNKEIKFKLLYDWAMKRGFDYLATGHYGRIAPKVVSRKSLVSRQTSGNYRLKTIDYRLLRSADEFKDQTYFIYNIRPKQLPHLMFPVGGMKKTAVRALAKKLGLPNAEKKESMGLCFVGKIRLKDFLEQKLHERPGQIFDQSQNVIGIHPGLHNFTLGQRQGINVGAGGPYYVVKKDLKRNRLYVTNDPADEALMTKEIQIHSVNWLIPNFQFSIFPPKADPPLADNFQLLGRYRHQGQLVPLTLEKNGAGTYKVHFFQPQKAVASGQSLVLYKGKVCVGGGVIV